jgi:hypothetical protein
MADAARDWVTSLALRLLKHLAPAGGSDDDATHYVTVYYSRHLVIGIFSKFL